MDFRRSRRRSSRTRSTSPCPRRSSNSASPGCSRRPHERYPVGDRRAQHSAAEQDGGDAQRHQPPGRVAAAHRARARCAQQGHERPGRDATPGGRAHDQRVEGLHGPAVRQPAETVARRRRDGRVSDAGGVAAPRNQEHLPAQGAAATERRRRVLASQGSRARREGLLSSNRSAPITCSGAPTPSGGAPLIGRSRRFDDSRCPSRS